MRIRKATLKDVDRILELWREYEQFEESITHNKEVPIKKREDADKNMKANLLRVIKSKNAEIFLGEEHKKIVAFILISKNKHDDIHDFDYYGCINYLYVKPEYRGKGFGSQLFVSSKKWFKQKKLEYLNLNLNMKNRKAKNIYTKWGFCNHEVSMWRKLK